MGLAARGTEEVSVRSFSTDPRELPPRSDSELRALERCEAEIDGRVRDVLEREAKRAALLARVGSDLSTLRFAGDPPKFTHVGFALRDGHEWNVHHLLNTHGGPRGDLYRQPLIDFFRDDPFEYRTAILVPSIRLQEGIAAVLGSPLHRALHTPHYSRIAYPFSTRYINSNQWVAEVIAAARTDASTRDQAQRALASSGLEPSVLLGIGPVKQLFSALFTRNTRLDDHPTRNRLRGRFEFLLEASLRSYLLATDAVRAFEVVDLDGTDPEAGPDSSRAPIA